MALAGTLAVVGALGETRALPEAQVLILAEVVALALAAALVASLVEVGQAGFPGEVALVWVGVQAGFPGEVALVWVGVQVGFPVLVATVWSTVAPVWVCRWQGVRDSVLVESWGLDGRRSAAFRRWSDVFPLSAECYSQAGCRQPDENPADVLREFYDRR